MRTPIGETTFTLVYGHEAMPSVEVDVPTYQVHHYEQNYNNRRQEEQLDLIEEIQDEAKLTMTAYKKRVEHYFNQRVCLRLFKIRGLILK